MLSCLSPCILPFIPAFLIYLGGWSHDLPDPSHVWPSAASYLLGVCLAFGLIAVAATVALPVAPELLTLASRLAGVVLVFFGFHVMGRLGARVGTMGGLGVGVASGLAWTPCIGPVLAAGLALAGAQANPVRAIVLSSLFVGGLVLPFVALSLALSRRLSGFRQFRDRFPVFQVVAGALVILVGVLVAVNRFSLALQMVGG